MVALSALINALYETNMALVVRKVYSAATAPKLGCLLPHIKSLYEVRPGPGFRTINWKYMYTWIKQWIFYFFRTNWVINSKQLHVTCEKYFYWKDLWFCCKIYKTCLCLLLLHWLMIGLIMIMLFARVDLIVWFQCLIYVELPFREDIRQYTFGSLPLKQDTEANKKYRPTGAF